MVESLDYDSESEKKVEVQNGCATRRTHQKTLPPRCILCRNRPGGRNGIRKAHAPQSVLRGGVRSGGRQGEQGGLETKRSRMESAAASGRTTRNVVGKRTGGDQQHVGSEETRSGGVAEWEEEALAAVLRRGLQRAPMRMLVVERNVLGKNNGPLILAISEWLSRCLLCMTTICPHCRGRVVQYAALSRGSAAARAAASYEQSCRTNWL